MPSADVYRIDWKEASWICDLEPLAFQCTDELAPLDRFIGQDRAQEAIRFGLEMDKPGYNLFVTGLTGTGKTSVIKSQIQLILEDPKWTDKWKPNSDWIYVRPLRHYACLSPHPLETWRLKPSLFSLRPTST